MNEQVSMMNQQQQQLMNQKPPPPMVSGVSQPPPPQMMSQLLQQPSQPQMLMNPPPPQQTQQMMNRSYGMWPPAGLMDRHQPSFRKPNSNPQKAVGLGGGKPLGPRNNWKGKKVNKRKDFGRRIEGPVSFGGSNNAISVGNVNVGIGGGYKPPTLNELQHENRVKARRFFPKKNFNNKNNNYNKGKFAPRNTTSFIIRAKKSGGITDLVSPYPVTPAVLPTPIFSPSREVLVDMAKEEWGVDGYGSMKGLIRLRSPGLEAIEGHEEEDSDEGGSSESDVEEHVEVERRLDHDLSRFEMIYPNYGTASGMEHNNILENRVDDQDSHIAQLEEENLILKERLFLMEREMGDLRRRLLFLERQSKGGEGINEEVEENESENDSGSNEDGHSVEVNNEEMDEEIDEADRDTTVKENSSYTGQSVEAVEKDEKNVGVADTEQDKFQVMELKEQINDIDLVEQNVKENNPCSETVEERSLGACSSMEYIAPADEAITAENPTTEEASDGKGSEKSIGEGV